MGHVLDLFWYIVEFFRNAKGTQEEWTPRERNAVEEELTEFEKKHFK